MRSRRPSCAPSSLLSGVLCRCATILLSNLGLELAAGSTLDTLSDRAVDVVLRDPALIVALASRGGNSSVGLSHRDCDADLANLLGGLGLLSLGEQSLDPSLVDKVEGSGESSGQEEVEEDASKIVSGCRPNAIGSVKLGTYI